MPRPKNPVPTYRLHKQSGQAVVTVPRPGGGRRDILLGPYDSPESKAEYRRVLAELDAGAYRPAAGGRTPDLTVAELLAEFWRFAERKHPARTLDNYRDALRPLRRLYGHTPAADFGPLAFDAYRRHLVAGGLARATVNKRAGLVKVLFKWGVGRELVPPAVAHGLAAVGGLRRGDGEARETAPVAPVPEADARAVMPHVRPAVAAMIEVQLLSGMRPGEVCRLRPCEVDASGPVWVYRPAEHKSKHRGKDRAVALGPKAQAVLTRFAPADPADFYFSPGREVQQLHVDRAAARKTARWPSHLLRNARKRVAVPERPAGPRYTTGTYAQAVARGCRRAGVPHWHPNQVRHTFATAVRTRFGLEAAQVALGHSRADVTQVYAARDMTLAAEVAGRIG